MKTGTFDHGVAHFNAREFFKAHEVWEELWLGAADREKALLQGLIQIAAAFHHYGLGNLRGARSLATAGMGKLDSHPDGYRGIDVARLVSETKQWIEGLTAPAGELRPLPQIHRIGGARGSGRA